MHSLFVDMNCLLICGNIHPSSSQGVRYKNLFSHLSQQVEIITLSYAPLEIFDVQKNVFIKREVNNTGAKSSKGIKRYLVKVYKKFFRQFIFPDRYKYALPAYKKHIRSILASQKIDTVIIGMTPYSLYPLTRFIKGVNSEVKVFVDLSDPFFGNAGNKGKLLFNKIFVKRYEGSYLKYCDGAVVLNPTIKKLYKEVYDLNNHVHIVEQGFSMDDINHNDIVNNTDKQNLIYAGGLHRDYRNPFPLYHAINQTNMKWHLDLYGNISEELLPRGNSWVHYHGLTEHNNLIKEYARADVLVFIDNAFGYQVPGKLLELISFDKPVLFIYSNPKSPSLYYVAEASHVFKVQNDADKIAEKLNEIRETTISFERIRGYRQYEWKNLANKYLNIINE